MKNFFVFNEGFSKSKTSSYILSLQLDETGYSYVITDTVGNIYAALNHHNFDKKILNKSILEKAEIMIKEDLFLSKNYKTVYFSLVTNKATLIPAELFDKKSLKELFTFNHKLNEFEELHFNYIDKIACYNVFAIPSDLTTILVNKFPEIIFVHQNNVFINHLIKVGKNIKFKLPVVHVNLNAKTFEIAIYQDEQFVMLNSFLYTNENDFVYYLLNTLEQYDIKLNKMHLNITGFLEKDTEFYYFVHQFIPKLKLLSLDSKITYNFKDVDSHLLYNVLNLHNENN
jgi:hypothetical protein